MPRLHPVTAAMLAGIVFAIPMPALAAPAQPIILTEKSARLDFRYEIPAVATTIAPLNRLLRNDADRRKAAALRDQRAYAADLPADAPAHAYGIDLRWKPVGETRQLLVLMAQGYVYTGGAHGSDTFEPLVWDKRAGRRIAWSNLFNRPESALAAIRPDFCRALAAARAKRIGRSNVAGYDCPSLKQYVAVAPAGNVGGKFSRIDIWVPADVAGSHAEGSYRLALTIPRTVAALVRPTWRASFPGQS